MSQFLKVKTVEEVLAILRRIEPLEAESVDTDAACGRILAEDLSASEPVPHFPRALMDGYAVRARDTFGASETLPALLSIGGEVSMGKAALGRLDPGQAIAVPTGGMLPAGADAVSMVEYSYFLDEQTIEVTRPVAPGDNVLAVGEDIGLGEKLFPAGWRLRPQDIGVLAALGVTSVEVHRRPRVAILSTGDEIVPVSTRDLPPGKVRDINALSLAGLVEAAGAVTNLKQIVPDDLESLVSACRKALAHHDALLFSGGSSVGARDYTLKILDHFPEGELLVHGVAIRPGKPTILAKIGKKVFWGLPGHPVSAMTVFEAFVRPSLQRLQGWREATVADSLASTRKAILSRRLPSVHGRTDYVPVGLSMDRERLLASPIFGKSASINILARADGYVIIPEHVEGLDVETEVEVHLYSH
jgi:molybdopterin molybdotransferase